MLSSEVIISCHFMALCSYIMLIGKVTPCGRSPDYPGEVECITLEDCRPESLSKALTILQQMGRVPFDELEGFVLQLGELGLGKEWQVRYVKSLKVAKFYLRGDFKVSNQKCFKKIGLRFSSRVILFHK